MPPFRGIGRLRVLRPANRRLLTDPHVLLGIAIAISATIIESTESISTAIPVALAGVAYVSIQVFVASHRRFLRSVTRLLIALGFLFGLAVVGGPTHAVPLTLLTLPIVAMAARYGRPEALVVGIASVSVPLIPALAGIESTQVVLARGSAFIATTFLVALGTRLAVEAMEAAVRRARASFARERRRARQMAGVEAVGRLLATDPSPGSLNQVMDLLVQRFGYSMVSIYLKDDDGSLVLGAQRGYERVLERFDGSTGVVGRVMRSGEVQLVRDVRLDPDYCSANDDVRSEISAPLFAGGELIGVLNLEDPRVDGLDETDRSTLVLVAERLAGAIALAIVRSTGRTVRARRMRAADQCLARPQEVYPSLRGCIAVIQRHGRPCLWTHPRHYRIAAVKV
jgi:putative methionine-R-sulfoxide reductase with GAF domain